ncbi:hypothetical protein PHMEG_00010446 [Phytophthora megakarya]|uniref:Uncharacterized protein n=1 Tax=Phytophthora megakarya TaxID=4795 RepID=A0A225WDP1_9STRA|nr:hypothetical protein PHMEG_00010446 [Phytophthora megakarya]
MNSDFSPYDHFREARMNKWFLPFQLLLLVLRWSHFHPELVRAVDKKFRRQISLIPQARIQRELVDLQRREMHIWTRLYPSADSVEESIQIWQQEHVMSPLLLGTLTQSQELSPQFGRISECRLWDTQKQFYKDQGIRAWSSGAIPFGVSSSSFLASTYARVVVDFLLENAEYVKPCFNENGHPNCFVWEAASGSFKRTSGKFLHSFLLHFTELVEANDEFKRRGLIPLVVATDLSEQVLNSRRQMKCFRSFIERGLLDFALFDTHDFIHGKKRKTLELIHSQRQWHVGSDGPVALMGNYFFDSLRADIFSVAMQRSPTVNTQENSTSVEHPVIQEALIDLTTASISDMNVNLRPISDPRTKAVYDDKRLNAILGQILNQFHVQAGVSSAVESISSTGLILFPVEAFEFFITLIDQADQDSVFPIAILAGDARFSFRDAISSAFITTTEASNQQICLELPQLSPHPDCFCLPVDFEIFRIFFENLNDTIARISANTELVSAPASDTFDVFFATVKPSRKKKIATNNTTSDIITSFKHQLTRFTPGDCDLLWGMMSFDDGARCFSADTLLALLAQTSWDFDLFSVLHWELLNRLRWHIADMKSENYRNILIKAGIKSWRTFYHMEQQTETDVTTRETRLQLARWFYGKVNSIRVCDR